MSHSGRLFVSDWSYFYLQSASSGGGVEPRHAAISERLNRGVQDRADQRAAGGADAGRGESNYTPLI